MSRQPNFSELREAIRQGQMKISQGLKNGQMRSDRNKDDVVQKPRLDLAHEMLGKKPVLNEKPVVAEEMPSQVKKPDFLDNKPTLTEKSALFEKHEDIKVRFTLPKLPRFPKLPKIRVRLPQIPSIPLPGVRSMLYGVGTVLGVALVVLVAFGIGKTLMGLRATPPKTIVAADSPPVTVQKPPVTRPVVQKVPVVVPRPVVEPPKRVETVGPVPAKPALRTGSNMIVIQGITSSREDEMKPVQDYFAKNGIPTDIIRRDNKYSLLVTRETFDNPDKPGTSGYEMKKKIKSLGKNYPAQTGDKKFGAEPFQDAYGKLK